MYINIIITSPDKKLKLEAVSTTNEMISKTAATESAIEITTFKFTDAYQTNVSTYQNDKLMLATTKTTSGAKTMVGKELDEP